jgi:hypothetical protein
MQKAKSFLPKKRNFIGHVKLEQCGWPYNHEWGRFSIRSNFSLIQQNLGAREEPKILAASFLAVLLSDFIKYSIST